MKINHWFGGNNKDKEWQPFLLLPAESGPNPCLWIPEFFAIQLQRVGGYGGTSRGKKNPGHLIKQLLDACYPHEGGVKVVVDGHL